MRRFSANATASVVMALLASTVVAAEGKTPRYDFGSKAGVAELAKFVSPLPDGRGLPRGSGNAADIHTLGRSRRRLLGSVAGAGGNPRRPPCLKHGPHAATFMAK
ncbi:MAG: hypothetical protein ACXWIH_13945 [Burkholderiales bacterium]